ncbi:MAG: hypothetical protein AB4042_17790 [Leptolyngbyaceae cyanobacterium]
MANYPQQPHSSSMRHPQRQPYVHGAAPSPYPQGSSHPHPPAQPTPEWMATAPLSTATPSRSPAPSTGRNPDPAIAHRRRPWLPRIMGHWLFWMTTSIAITGGVAGFAGATLFKLPSLPNCPKIFWPMASASLRMHCAEQAADKNTPRDLLEAIALVDELPGDHPLRSRVNRLIDQWSLDMLDLAEISFHQGDLEGAIAAAKRVPRSLAAYEQVDTRIDQWQTVWADAEKIYQDSEALLEQEDLRGAFTLATKLLTVENEYWKTAQYNLLTELIESSRIDTELLNQARRLAKSNNVTDLIEAMGLLEKIQPTSRLYPPARRALSRFLEELVDLGVKALVAGDADTAMEVSRNLPNGVEFKAKAQDLRELSFAISQASSGMVPDLESAILQAQDLGPNRPLYSNAQALIQTWELEVQDIHHLSRARGLAAMGLIPDLQAAIAEAQLVGYNHPRFDEAETAINGWQTQIYTLQDQPHLDEARRLAAQGSIRSLDAAIRKAKLIPDGRPLSTQANNLINQWTIQVQTLQDRPYLDDAVNFANRGNLPAAIAAAQRIRPNRALHDEAQAKIRRWQDDVNGDIFFQQANDIARQNTPSAWARAIQVASRISERHPNYPQSARLMDRWSQSILTQAQQIASISYQEAIEIANLVPSGTAVYRTTQLQIETWQRAIAQEEQWRNRLAPILPIDTTIVEPLQAEPLQAEPPQLEPFQTELAPSLERDSSRDSSLEFNPNSPELDSNSSEVDSNPSGIESNLLELDPSLPEAELSLPETDI